MGWWTRICTQFWLTAAKGARMQTLDELYNTFTDYAPFPEYALNSKHIKASWVFAVICAVLLQFFIIFCDLLPRLFQSARKLKPPKTLPVPNPLGTTTPSRGSRSLRHRGGSARVHATSKRDHAATEEPRTADSDFLDNAHQVQRSRACCRCSCSQAGLDLYHTAVFNNNT
eukprot:9467808-Pyramimonas_sp.AAC.1